jgi:hypothetical protein
MEVLAMSTQTQEVKRVKPAGEPLPPNFFAKANPQRLPRDAGDIAKEYNQLAEHLVWLEEENSRLKTKIQLLQELCLLD